MIKTAGIVLIIAGAGLAASFGFFELKLARGVDAHIAAMDSLKTERGAVVEELTEVNLDNRALMRSLNTQPDSLRMRESGRISRRMRELNTRARQLNMNETELARLIRREQRLMEAESTAARAKTRPLGIGAAACLLAGFLLTLVARRQGA